MKVYLVIGYLYCEDDSERDTTYPLGIASSREKANTLIEEWADLMINEEDGYKDLEEVPTQFGTDRTYKAIDEFKERWTIDVVILETELDKLV